ncbi:ribose ABC transporter permease [Arthrobacter crystallopoietes BAB-32]|uniref:Ribose ABC transporter permease n=1 Tax=Arthrobacter crystallopoietes BAB-32 TaxID=1246476 RepID=N1V1G7_9MICC|nr:ABC transporter permease [Arthrobacter crystallopoietes]EMY35185.1 ribose ABC transporter permease [Arthrobacter crystallopoietes BAB-32]
MNPSNQTPATVNETVNGAGTAPPVEPRPDTAPKPRERDASPVRRVLPGAQDLALIGALVVLCAGFTIASPHFFTEANLINVLRSVAIIGTISAIMTLVLISGALDLSVGSIMGITGVLAAVMMSSFGLGPLTACAAALALGVVCGLLNAFCVVRLRINPIIVTIGTLALFRGIAFILTDGREIAVRDPFFDAIGFDRWLLLPVPVWVMLAVFTMAWWIAKYSVWGRTVYSVGSNPRASRLAGLPVDRARVIILAASGLAASVAGLLMLAQGGIAVPSAGTGYELQVLTAVLLGGTSLAGGEGRVARTLVGVLIIGVINNGMTLLAVPSYYQTVAGGVLLLVAVAIDQARRGAGYR